MCPCSSRFCDRCLRLPPRSSTCLIAPILVTWSASGSPEGCRFYSLLLSIYVRSQTNVLRLFCVAVTVSVFSLSRRPTCALSESRLFCEPPVLCCFLFSTSASRAPSVEAARLLGTLLAYGYVFTAAPQNNSVPELKPPASG